MTVNELLGQHNKVLQAKADCDSINFLYEGDDPHTASMREGFFEGAYKRYLAEVSTMKDMMNRAEPGVLAEAKRIAKEQRPKNQEDK